MNDPMVPIYSCNGNAREADVMCKTSLYANTQICRIWSGNLSGSNPAVSALHLAEIMCEALEAQRERDGEQTSP